MKKVILGLWTAAILIPSPLLIQSAAAQSNATLEEIVVTARKREESVMDIPTSISTFSAGMIERADLRSLSDIGLTVPNMYMGTRLDGVPNVSMRGLGGFGNTQGVGFFLDDVQLFSDASSRFGDLERIEVLKGPQGVLYGGANIGGAVKFVSKRPDFAEMYGDMKVSLGEDAYYDVEGQVNLPFSDQWAARLFGFAETDDGYLTNPNSTRSNGLSNNNSEDVGAMDRYGVRAALAGNINEGLTTYFTLRYNKLDAPNNTWIRELDGDFEYSDIVDTSFNPRHNRETMAATTELNFSSDNVTTTFIASYTDTESLRESDLDLDQEYVLDLFRPEDLTATTIELRFSSDTDASLQWQVGAYHMNLERDLTSVLNIRGGFCFLDPGDCAPGTAQNDDNIDAVAPFEVSERDRVQTAVFANATYRMEQWEFSAGLRADDWESRRINRDTQISGQVDDTEILARASATWHSNSGNSIVYGNFSQGFEPGDLNLTNFAGENSLFGYGAESAAQYELGYKGQLLDGALSFVAAAFFIDYEDRQFELQATDVNTGTPVEGIINVGDSKQRGFETDIAMALSENWTVGLGLGYVDSDWDDDVVSPITDRSLAGETPPNTSDWGATASADYIRQTESGLSISGRLDVRYKGDAATNAQFFDAVGDGFPIWDNPSFAVVNASVGIAGESWEVRLYVENLFDENYYIDVQEFPNFAGTAIAGAPADIIIGTLEQPRRAKISLKYLF